MYISARERKIIEQLLRAKQDITIKEIAKSIQVSDRTVHRDLKGVEDILDSFGVTLVKQSGRGLELQASQPRLDELHEYISQLNHEEYTPEERKVLLISKLLHLREPVKLFTLATELNVTAATISTDLSRADDWLGDFQLSVVRKRGSGIDLSGTETNKRRAMSRLLVEFVNEEDFYSLIHRQPDEEGSMNTVSARLLHLVDKDMLSAVEEAVQDVRGDLPYEIADSAYIGLVIHLTLSIERIKLGEEITMKQGGLEEMMETAEWKLAGELARRLEGKLAIQIPQAETGYITMHLRGAKLSAEQYVQLDQANMDTVLYAKKLIRYVDKKIAGDLEKDSSLLQGLVTHLYPALYRIKEGMKIHNPMTGQIKEEYPVLFQTLEEGVKAVFPGLDIPDEEVAYLVMHFGSVMNQRRRNTGYTALVICSSGVGSAKMLASRIQKEISLIDRVQTISVQEMMDMNLDDYDLVLSTIKLTSVNRDYFVVSPFLPQSESVAIHQHLQQLKPKAKETKQESNAGLHIDHFEGYSKSVNAIVSLLNQFEVYRFDSADIPGLLDSLCTEMEKEKKIESAEEVSKALIEREKLGGLGIPNTGMALFHARTQAVKQPVFTIARISGALMTKGMDGGEQEITTVLCMVTGEDSSQEELQVLSSISAAIVHDEKSLHVFEYGEKDDVLHQLSKVFNDYLKSL
ncbi:BglG family transcription antiterminator [Alteribacter keqinensis]|uniref:PRD domain-containing protein n=1 Tax=Alteribacter keqinensis TaxID=2483800 RepID=A0A3M7TSW0_9BACI|nr:BglG family transcription antiterminator [Alteribacter keqinensis]RNA67423.1 PRD domain-containing protein [Alteribacter keqinensis]